MSSKLQMINFLQKKNRKVFSDRHPDKWIPLYSQLHLAIDRMASTSYR
jgi:hypothetical protein